VRLAALPFKNAVRYRGRAALTAGAVAATVIAFLVVRAAVTSFGAGMRQASAERLGVRHKLSFTLPLPQRYAAEVAEVPGVRAVTWALWFNGRDPRDPAHVFTSLAVDPASWLAVFDEIELDAAARARWLADRGSVILGAPLAERLGVGPGDTLTLRGTVYPGDWRFTVAGVYRVTRDSQVERQLLLHWQRVDDAVPAWRKGRMGWAAARVDDAARAAEVARAIDARFATRDVRTVTMSERAVFGTFLGLVAAVLRALDVVAAVLAAVVMLVVGGAVATAQRERTGETAVLRALGFSPGRIGALVVAEGALLGGGGGLAGALLALPVVDLGVGRWLEDHMSGLFPSFSLPVGAAAAAVVGAAAAGAIAALLPARAAARLPAAEALRRAGE
jgi:putative ABC transport system permease protein